MDRGAWWAVVHGVAKESDMTEQLTLKQPIPLVYSTPDTVIHCPFEEHEKNFGGVKTRNYNGHLVEWNRECNKGRY